LSLIIHKKKFFKGVRRFNDGKDDFARVEKSLKELIKGISLVFNKKNDSEVMKDIDDLIEFEKKLDEVKNFKTIPWEFLNFNFSINENFKSSGISLRNRSKIKTVVL
jgi:hypothetical protein